MESDKITVKQFKHSWFNEDYSEISKERFELCYSEYLDFSGLYRTKTFDDFAYIHYLSNRVSSILMGINVQRDYLETFGVPYIEGLEFFKKYNYTVYWNGNQKEFLDYLLKIEKKEKKYKIELDNKRKLFIDAQKENKPIVQTRQDFIIMVNTLNRIGYRVTDDTSVEELALMIKQNRDERN